MNTQVCSGISGTQSPHSPVLKSELGILNTCTQCQKRKVKCDGAKPSCLNCSRRFDCCVYRRSIRYRKIPQKKSPKADASDSSDTQKSHSSDEALSNNTSLGYLPRFSTKPHLAVKCSVNPTQPIISATASQYSPEFQIGSAKAGASALAENASLSLSGLPQPSMHCPSPTDSVLYSRKSFHITGYRVAPQNFGFLSAQASPSIDPWFSDNSFYKRKASHEPTSAFKSSLYSSTPALDAPSFSPIGFTSSSSDTYKDSYHNHNNDHSHNSHNYNHSYSYSDSHRSYVDFEPKNPKKAKYSPVIPVSFLIN